MKSLVYDIAAEDREWALRKVLQNINTQVERASRAGVAIWFPMGDSNLRVVRLAARESNLLNSRCLFGVLWWRLYEKCGGEVVPRMPQCL